MSDTRHKELLIVDGSHYLYRAYYGVPESAKLRSGLQVNAVYGFIAYLRKAIKLINPSHIFVVFDSETGIKDKVQENTTYKSNRDYSDVGMYKQLPLIQNILSYLEIKFVEPVNHEADDYIGSLSAKAGNLGFIATVFSNDADFLQLINPAVRILKVGRKNLDILDEDTLQTMLGFGSNQYVSYLSLKGDTSDNVKGVPGIGPKTAQTLIKEYGTLDYLFDNVEKIPGKTGEALKKHQDLVRQNYKLLKINTEIDEVALNIEEFTIKNLKFLDESTNILLDKIGVRTP